MNQPTALQTLIPIVVILVVVSLRMRSITRERPLKIEQLWIVPAIYAVIAGLIFFGQPPHAVGWIASAVALLIGAALGWQRGRMMHITVDPETQALKQKGSLAAMFFLLGLIVLRTALREAAIYRVGGLQIDVSLVADVLVALALGLLSVQRLEMYLRAKRLLEAARAA